MFLEDEDHKKATGQPKNLEPMSVDELEEYIVDLKAEIDRAGNEIAKKQAQKAAADSFFK